jgi:DNA polymerase-3 subunit alpha
MDPATEVGLVKMDFLGLKTLSAVEATAQAVERNCSVKLDVRNLPLDDAETYALLSRGDTPGVFQVESEGMRRLLRSLRPDRFEHLVPLIALYRPGPLDEMDTFCAGRHGVPPVYLHPDLEPILRETWGVLLYQEQVMRATVELAGFTMGQAEITMRAMSKKNSEKMAEQRPLFMAGCAEHGIAERTADQIWERMAKFAGYGFNKSHSAAYALIVYWTAYLKAHYPAEYMAATISSYIEDSKQVAKYVAESRRIELDVLPPAINESEATFTGEDRTIRFGLAAIKGIGLGCAESIVEERNAHGPFQSLADFCRRVPAGHVGRSSVETLIRAGAFDALGERAALLAGLDQAWGAGRRAQSDAAVGQTSLFGGGADADSEVATEPRLPAVAPMSDDEKLACEKELLGLYVSDHPLLQAQERIDQVTTARIEDLHEFADGQGIIIGGMVGKLSPYTTKSGAPMLFFTLQGLAGEIEVTVFPKTYESSRDLFQLDALLVVSGKLQRQESETMDGERVVEVKVVCDRVRRLSDARKPSRQKLAAARQGRTAQQQAASADGVAADTPRQPIDTHLCVRLAQARVCPPLLEQMRSVLQGSRGTVPVQLMLDDGRAFMLADDYSVAVTRGFMQQMSELVGPSAAILVASS